MTRIPRTSAENPYCANQRANDEPVEEITEWSQPARRQGEYVSVTKRYGVCGRCLRFVPVRKNGTPKLHRQYGRRQAQINAHAAKRYDAELAADRDVWGERTEERRASIGMDTPA